MSTKPGQLDRREKAKRVEKGSRAEGEKHDDVTSSVELCLVPHHPRTQTNRPTFSLNASASKGTQMT